MAKENLDDEGNNRANHWGVERRDVGVVEVFEVPETRTQPVEHIGTHAAYLHQFQRVDNIYYTGVGIKRSAKDDEEILTKEFDAELIAGE